MQVALEAKQPQQQHVQQQVTDQFPKLILMLQDQDQQRRDFRKTIELSQIKYGPTPPSQGALLRQSARTPAHSEMLCPHTDKRQYARKMCHKCYHLKGKKKLATKCAHLDQPHYSNGMCQTCYLADYYQKRKAKKLRKMGQP
jgi:hypothetical protein